jgi:SAM-dependent methyltransferase
VSRVTFLLEAVAVSNPQTIANSSPARSEIEALLLEHPNVIDASLINEEGPDGHSYPVAYVVPHAERMKEAKTRIYLTDRDKRVAQWRKAFDQVYRQGSGDHAPTFVGWTSSYTNKPLPETEMREWLDCTTARVMSFRPEKVLEIGCGVGLLVQELAPCCSVYRGTDLSMVAVGRLREFVASKPELRHVELYEREATNLDEQPPGSVDTVVINSVIQYFPDIHYLRTVIEGAARIVSSGGRIFIGDVRHLGLLPLFHGAVQLAKAPPTASARWLKRKVSLAVEQDRELVIDPQFFLELTHSNPRISGVEILLKRGQAHNELTRYRYDVVLHVGETKSIPSRQEAEWQAGNLTVAELVSRFDTRQLASVTVMDVPNRRLASDLAGVRRLWSANDRQLVGDIRRAMAAETDPGCDPEDFWKLSDTQPRDVRIGWSPHSADGHFDVVLVARDRAPGAPSLQRATYVASASRQRPLATDPLEVAFMQQLGLELRQLLSDRLPESRLPAAVLAVNELPSGAAATLPGSAVHFLQQGDGRTASRQMVEG